MTTVEFFGQFWEKVRQTQHWEVMENTVENSPWHREENVAVHTAMTIAVYMNRFYEDRTERQRMLTLLALLFHDFGKPEAEETLEKKDEPGVFYRRYAGHEPISGNEFISFMCDQHELRTMFFDQGYSWADLRTIKVMIEHHLPYGLKNEQKRQNLANMISMTLGPDEVCFYDMLRSDAAGRISDDHETKLQNVEDWINGFKQVSWKPVSHFHMAPTLILLVGISGAGKSTYVNALKARGDNFNVFSEDDLRLHYALANFDEAQRDVFESLTTAEQYDMAWKFCHLSKDSKFDSFSMAKFVELLDERKIIVLDRMNQSRKGRGKYIQQARQKGYNVQSIEFMISESMAKARQAVRGDKRLPEYRVHQLYMQLETPWLGPEVERYDIVEQK